MPAFTLTLIHPAAKHGIDVGAGVIDADYRGLLGVILFNHSDVDFQGESLCNHHAAPGPHTTPLAVSPGDRVAQLILERIATPQVEGVEVRHLAVRALQAESHNLLYYRTSMQLSVALAALDPLVASELCLRPTSQLLHKSSSLCMLPKHIINTCTSPASIVGLAPTIHHPPRCRSKRTSVQRFHYHDLLAQG